MRDTIVYSFQIKVWLRAEKIGIDVDRLANEFDSIGARLYRIQCKQTRISINRFVWFGSHISWLGWVWFFFCIQLYDQSVVCYRLKIFQTFRKLLIVSTSISIYLLYWMHPWVSYWKKSSGRKEQNKIWSTFSLSLSVHFFFIFSRLNGSFRMHCKQVGEREETPVNETDQIRTNCMYKCWMCVCGMCNGENNTHWINIKCTRQHGY